MIPIIGETVEDRAKVFNTELVELCNKHEFDLKAALDYTPVAISAKIIVFDRRAPQTAPIDEHHDQNNIPSEPKI